MNAPLGPLKLMKRVSLASRMLLSAGLKALSISSLKHAFEVTHSSRPLSLSSSSRPTPLKTPV
jgi:hypothetical protein